MLSAKPKAEADNTNRVFVFANLLLEKVICILNFGISSISHMHFAFGISSIN